MTLDLRYIFPNLINRIESFALTDIASLRKLGHNVECYSFIPRLRKIENCNYLYFSLGDLLRGALLSILHFNVFIHFLVACYKLRNSKQANIFKSFVAIFLAFCFISFYRRSDTSWKYHLFWGHYPAAIIFVMKSLKISTHKFSMFLGAYDYYENLTLTHLAMLSKEIVVITHSAYHYNKLKASNYPCKIEVIYRGVAVESPQKEFTNKKYVNVCAGGRLIKQKRFDDVIKLLAHVKECSDLNVNVTIFGGGPKLSQLKGLCLDLQLADHVSFTGFLQKNELAEIYEMCDFMLMCSTKIGEILPNVIKEAMEAGVVPIVVETKGIEELIDTDENGYIFKNFQEMRKGLISILTMPIAQLKINSANSQRTISERFNTKNTMQEYVEAWKNR